MPAAAAAADGAMADDKRAAAEGVAADASPPPAAAAADSALALLNPKMAGLWTRDNERSTPMDYPCDVMQLGTLVRMAIRLLRGIEVKIRAPSSEEAQGRFDLSVYSVIPWFRLWERYELDGAEAQCNRRDVRAGKHKGHVKVLPDGNLQVYYAWQDPLAGQGVDDFVMVGDNELHVTSRIRLVSDPDKELSYTNVHYRYGTKRQS